MVDLRLIDGMDDALAGDASKLIETVWPDYAGLFRSEIALYQAHPALFAPNFAIVETGRGLDGIGVLVNSMMSTDLLSIIWVAVDAAERRRGIGRAIIDALMHEARRRDKAVILTTTTPEFYQALGFRLLSTYDPAQKHCIMLAESGLHGNDAL